MLKGKGLFITGGAGTLGRAIAKRWKEEEWGGKLTVYSTDTYKHAKMKQDFPEVRYICGDIRNYDTLYAAMVGHDIVIHGAAVKVIPVSEENVMDTIDVNVYGSQNVAIASIQAGVEKCIGISTDKACHPHNCYGMTKALMEKMFQEFQFRQDITDFHLVRYGNVLESTGSVVEAWRRMVENGEKIKVTDPGMTRFWLSPDQAVDYVLLALSEPPGTITIPKMPALSIGALAHNAVGVDEWDRIPLRPGEKIHETLLTWDEREHTEEFDDVFRLWPSFVDIETPTRLSPIREYTSGGIKTPKLTKEDLLELLGEEDVSN